MVMGSMFDIAFRRFAQAFEERRTWFTGSSLALLEAKSHLSHATEY